MRKKLIAGNWKMNKTPSESAALAEAIVKEAANFDKAELLICPVYTALDRVSGIIKNSNIKLGAQDLHWENQGAFTGKVSADMLCELGCSYAIIGHSEQRQYFHETDETVHKKTLKALSSGLIPVICVGETLDERESGKWKQIVERQTTAAYQGIDADQAAKTVIAYEPVWAIGTGKNATPEQAQEVHAFIRELLKKLYNPSLADSVRILYGGSMKPDNAAGLLSMPDIDGGLIGGAALKADSFLGIAKA